MYKCHTYQIHTCQKHVDVAEMIKCKLVKKMTKFSMLVIIMYFPNLEMIQFKCVFSNIFR